MGQGNSTPNESKEQKQLDNFKKLFSSNDDTDDILETLNITELKPRKQVVNQKKPLPLLGGANEPNDEDKNKHANRKRYNKYDLFKMLKDLDSEYQQGGGGEDDESSLDDAKSMEHIKSIILRELDALKKNKANKLGGSGCGCEGDKTGKNKNKKMKQKSHYKNVVFEKAPNKKMSGGYKDDSSSSSSTTSISTKGDSSSTTTTSEEAGYKSKKSKKTKKSKKSKKSKANKLYNDDEEVDNSDSSKFFIETSESGEKTSNGDEDDDSSSSSEEKKKGKKGKEDNDDEEENSEEGLSIFPFNSSDVKSSLSVKNYRMLRRKI